MYACRFLEKPATLFIAENVSKQSAEMQIGSDPCLSLSFSMDCCCDTYLSPDLHRTFPQ
jgi:hypothetical protein